MVEIYIKIQGNITDSHTHGHAAQEMIVAAVSSYSPKVSVKKQLITRILIV